MAGQKVQHWFFYGYVIVMSASLIMIITWGTYFAFGIFFKPVLIEFGWTRAMTAGAFSLSLIMFGLLGIVMGGLTDRFGPRTVLTFCGAMVGIGYLLMSQISTVWQLYLFYGVLLGVGMGGAWVPLLSTVARWFEKRRSMMTGIVTAGYGIGILIGPAAANWLISTYNWRTSYIMIGSIVLAVVVIAAQFLRRDPSSIGQVPYGEKEGEEHRSKVETEGFSLKGAVFTRQFWFLLAIITCFGYCLFTITVHVVPYATDLGISSINAVNTLAILGGLTIVGNIIAGSAGDRIGNRRVLIICFILMMGAVFWLVRATEVWMFFLFAGIFGFAHGGFVTSESPIIAQLFGLRAHGLIFGVLGIGFTIGAAVGPLLTGYMFDVNGDYRLAFLVCASIGIIGLILTLLLKPIKGTS